ncbi:MAG: agmatinase, partial [Desulfurobacteriaceae bacterium]
MKFLSSKEFGDVVILGVPFDSTTCFRPGARFGPDGIRFFSENLEEFSPSLKKSLASVEFTDAGNVEVPADPEGMVDAVYSFLKEKEITFPVVLGGDHSITYPVVKYLAEKVQKLTVVHFDAHADLRNEYSGTPFSHACVMRRVLNLGVDIVQVGIRSMTEEEFSLRKESDRIITVERLEELPALLSQIKMPVYFTVDIDFFDPAFAPGTGTPEPCGASPVDFFETLYKLPTVEVLGFDVVEVSPPYDPSGITQALGAKIVREFILKFWG